MHRILVDDPSTFIGPLHGPHLCHGAKYIVHSIIRYPGHFLCGLSVSYVLSKFSLLLERKWGLCSGVECNNKLCNSCLLA